MESEKVKEIKNNLNTEIKLAELNKTRFTELISVDLIKDILTLINELESENERLLEQRNKTYNIWVKDTEKLKDRIAELECSLSKKTMEYELLKCGKKIGDGIVEVIDEAKKSLATYEALKQFAERLKEELEEYRLENEYFIKDEPNGNLWQLNSSVFCLEVTQDGGLVDETLKEFIK